MWREKNGEKNIKMLYWRVSGWRRWKRAWRLPYDLNLIPLVFCLRKVVEVLSGGHAVIQSKNEASAERLAGMSLQLAIDPPPIDGMTRSYSPAHADAASAPSLPTVAILLCTYHGQHYLVEQLDSLAMQTYQNWVVWASDDGSRDATRAILERYSRQWGRARLSVDTGPAQGFAFNFLSLTCKSDIRADYYAYSDQDDIWEADKLQRAIDCLRQVPAGVPALYCSRTRLVDANNQEIGLSPLFSQPPSFANALMQNIGGGNTMVFNDAARQLLCEAGPEVDVSLHDWWAYLLISGCGGRVVYDAYPSLRYRQHGGNVVGMNAGWRARANRVRMLWSGWFRRLSDRNVEALQSVRGRLTPENRMVFDRFSSARNRWLVPRLIGLKQSGIYRQTWLGNLGLVAAAIFKKI